MCNEERESRERAERVERVEIEQRKNRKRLTILEIEQKEWRECRERRERVERDDNNNNNIYIDVYIYIQIIDLQSQELFFVFFENIFKPVYTIINNNYYGTHMEHI